MKTTKKFCTALAMTALALSCTREAEVSDAISTGQEITITATLESGSKTAVQDGGIEVYWEPADEVKLFLNGSGSRFISNNTELAGIAQFTGTLNAVIGFNEGFADDNPLWGLYPYRADATSDETSVTTTLPADQVGRAGTFAKNTHITLGRSTSYSMGFYSVCGGLRFSLTQEGIKKVTFEGNNEEALAGTIKMAFEDGVPAIKEITEPQAKLTLTAPADGTLQTGVWYYIEAIPGSLSGGYKMSFYKEDESAKFTSNSPASFKRGVFGTLADADEGLIFKPTGGGGDDPDPEDLISFADPIAKYACIEKFDTNGDGEVSYAEAAAATTLSGLFTDWNTVTSFEEIKYFTGVTSTANVFNGLTQLDSITIPAQITTLGTFENCTALKKVVLPAALTSLPNYCFSGCNALVDITFPEGLTTIPYNCFRNCSALETIVLPSKVTSIGSYAFSGCSALQRAALPNGIKTLPGDCFSGCGALTEVELPAELTAIPNYCFRNCTSLSSLTIPKSVTSIGSYAFQGCSSLADLLLPENLNSIGTYAFQNCTSIEMIALPDGMTALSTGLFSGCKALTTISWPTNLQSIGDNAFSGCYFENNDYTLELPTSITSIGSNVFIGLRHILISSTSSVSISNKAFGDPTVYFTYLYVPAGKVEMYKARTNWNEYSDRIRPMSVYPIEKPEWNYPIAEPVDLGLSVKWASWNVGASAPEEYGEYFAWGETNEWVKKSYYTWDTYKWCRGSKTTLTKYCTNSNYGYNGFTDNKTVLEPEDDAATVIWGGKWRMPTIEEHTELINNCTWTWTTLNGVYGRKITSNKEGYTDKWIFLPSAGWYGTGRTNAGSYGDYWPSSLDIDYPFDAYGFYFSSSTVDWGSHDRCNGRSVRPVYTESLHVTGVKVSPENSVVEIGKSIQLTATVAPSNAIDKKVIWSSSDTSVATVSADGLVTAVGKGTAEITVKTVDGGFSASSTVATFEFEQWVDLGLSVKWGTCNIGASSPEKYGEYFAYGEVEPKEDFSWSTYKWCNGSKNTLTKYCTNSNYGYNGFTDNKTVLDPEDDVATVNLGDKWRMPTSSELDELKTQCTWTFTTLNGVCGMKVTSNKEGYTDKWIFLPAAGNRLGTSLNNVGSYGDYGSSSLYTGYPDKAYAVDFESTFVRLYYDSGRQEGQTVRPVCE